MGWYIIRRASQAGLTLLGVSLLVFLIIASSQDLVSLTLGRRVSPEVRQSFAQQIGLDQPLPVRYVNWLAQLASGDFGTSLRTRRPVLDLVAGRIPATLELIAASLVVSVIGGSIVAALASQATRARVGLVHALLTATPPFWLGLVGVLIFAVALHALPSGGRCSAAEGCAPIWARLNYLILPTLALSAAPIARYSRSMWAVGTSGARDDPHPLFRFMSTSLVTLLTSLVAVEAVFAWPGVGRLAVDATTGGDFPVVVALVILTSAFVILSSAVSDILGKARSAASQTRRAPRRSLELIRSGRPTWAPAATQFGRPTTVALALDRLRPPPPREISRRESSAREALRRLASDVPAEFLGHPRQRKEFRLAPAVILLLIVLVSVCAPLINQHLLRLDPEHPSAAGNALPIGSPGHPLGTDAFGRDQLARLLLAGQASLGIASVAALISLGIGVCLGMLAGARHPPVKLITHWVVAALGSVPALLLAMLWLMIHRPDPFSIIAVLALAGSANVARWRMNSQGARLEGRELLSGLAATTGALLLIESGLGFMNMSLAPPIPTWGNMLSAPSGLLVRNPSLLVMPGVSITLTVVCLYLLGGRAAQEN
jgi:peptide/nickel transport system permease protein